MIAGEYFDYAESLEKETKGGYGNCPQECPANRKKRYDVNRTLMCDTCPKKRQWGQFKEETLERWRAWFGETKFNFDSMLNMFYNIVVLDKLPDESISVKNAAVVSVYRSERSKAEARRLKT